MAILAPWLAPFDPDRQNLLSRLRPPGFAHGGMTYGSAPTISAATCFPASSTAYAPCSPWRRSRSYSSRPSSASPRNGRRLVPRLGRDPHHVVVDMMMSIPAILLAVVLTVSAVLGPVLEPGPAGTSPTSSGWVIHRGSLVHSEPTWPCARWLDELRHRARPTTVDLVLDSLWVMQDLINGKFVVLVALGKHPRGCPLPAGNLEFA